MERSYKSFKHTGFSLCIKHEIVELKVFLPVGRNKAGFRRTAGSHGLIRPELQVNQERCWRADSGGKVRRRFRVKRTPNAQQTQTKRTASAQNMCDCCAFHVYPISVCYGFCLILK